MTNEIKTAEQRRTDIYGEFDSYLFNIVPFYKLEVAELRAKVESLTANAERYQWLRHGDNDDKVIQRGPVADDFVYLPRNFKLDEMIDAAMAKEKS